MKRLLYLVILASAWLSTNAATTQLNILSFGASTNSPDNATAITTAFTAAARLKATLVWPAGIYISSPVSTVPGYFKIVGENNTGIKFPSQAGTILKLKAGAGGTLLSIVDGSSVDISSVFFDGNGTNQVDSSPLVWVKPFTYAGTRNEMSFNNCVFFNGSGAGLRINREEITVTTCQALFNGSHGFQQDDGATDIIYSSSVGSGFNGGDGFHFFGNTSATRMTQIDSYYNQGYGFFLDGNTGCGDLRVEAIQCNSNFKDNLHITNVVARCIFSKGIFYNANYQDNAFGVNNPAPSGTYNDIAIYGSSYTTDFTFTDCIIGVVLGGAPTKVPKYHILDGRTGTYSNGKGIAIKGGVLARSYDGGGIETTYSPLTMSKYWTCLGTYDSSAVGFPTRLGTNELWATGPLKLDGQANLVTIYKHEPGGLSFELNGDGVTKKYVGFYTNGWTSLPGELTVHGNLTNETGNLYNYGSIEMTALGRTLFYQDLGGGLGLAAGYGGANQKFLTFGTNGIATVTDFKLLTDSITNRANYVLIASGVPANIYQHQAGGIAFQLQGGGITNYVAFNGDGTITFPSDLSIGGTFSAPLLQLNELNTGTLTTTNGVIYRAAADGPSAATIGAGNGALWSSNSTPATLYWRTSDGATTTDTLVAP